MSSTFSAFVSSMFSSEPVYNDTPAPEPEKDEASAEVSEEKPADDASPAKEEEEEEEDPEDVRVQTISH